MSMLYACIYCIFFNFLQCQKIFQVQYIFSIKFIPMYLIYFFRFYLFIFREREREEERERDTDVWERHHWVASHTPPAGDLDHNPGMCPILESNQRHFGSQAGPQSTELYQPGLFGEFKHFLQIASFLND